MGFYPTNVRCMTHTKCAHIPFLPSPLRCNNVMYVRSVPEEDEDIEAKEET